jgi:DNA primase
MKDGRQAFFLFLPDGEDPDTIVRKEGAEGFDARLQGATPLSEFFFAHMAQDVSLSSLDGKARLAERCKPLLAQIPDGAFGDLMRQHLTELTGVGARASSPETHVPVQRARSAPPTPTAKKSLASTCWST